MLGSPYAARLLGGTLIGRLPNGMAPVAMLSGLLPAAFSAGSFLGGLVYGRRTWPGSTTRQLVFGSAAFLTGWLPLLALHNPYAATAAIALPGAFLTVVVACAYVTTDALTPTAGPARRTRG
ncbi:hypothetical protein [Streptomyces sp. NPDC087298]|uniref:hypothetical protein n=1 Tax=Streptomyces sp. NPDC087298 TaxID=3365779 RepID=UPI00380F11F9